ncbi:MAG TPA: hypothetical protein VLH77_04510, partial [Gammaproteobacteria bacterium]|nr:hypothetical protein [Gammaproteobacteria bacterium]
MKLKKSAYALNMVGLLTLTNLVYAAPAPSDIIVVGDTKHDISIPIRDVPKFSSHAKKGNSGFSLEKILQKNLAFLQISNFQGIGVGLGSYAVTTPAPDLSFSVGMTQALEWVDPDIAIFDKATGTVAAGFPKPGSAVWYGFGGPCETEDSGKPIVKYDQLANRWVISRQANADPNTGPFYQCVAISTSEDATDSYYRYAFPTDSLNNYAKMGLWSDAYYLATFLTGPVSHGARACALDRDKMLLGLAATAQCKQMTTDESGPLTPADLEGATQTPGLPGYFFSIEAPHDLLLFKFHVDFANPANTTFTSAISLPVQPFISPCSSLNGTACVVQPNTTNKLDILVDRFSSRIKYHQFENYGSILLAHNIEGPPPKLAPAIRWYELRVANNPQANPTIYQQATYAPD